jgi:hypothetical protein
LFVEGTEEKDRLPNAGVAERDGFVEFNDGEAEDFWLGFEELGGICDSHAVSIVLDYREDWARGSAARNLFDVVAKIFAMDFYPGIERGIFQSSYFRYWRRGSGGKRGSSIEKDGES